METAFDELKTHLRGGGRVLRSKTPDLVRQEAWGFMLAHFALRALMHEAALGALPRARDPDTLSFVHTLRVTRSRTWRPFPPQDRPRARRARLAVLQEVRAEVVSSSRGRVVPRGVKRKMSNFPLRPRRQQRTQTRDYRVHVRTRHRRPRYWSRQPVN